MKKSVALFLAAFMVVGCVACGGRGNEGNSEGNSQNANNGNTTITDANEILTKVWDKFEDEDTDGDMYNDKFAVIGGHFDDSVENAPGKYDVSKAEDLEASLCVPQDAIQYIDDAASMVHMMNANTFTAGAFHVTDKANVDGFVSAVKERTIGNQWMCGFPDKLLMLTIGDDYVVSAYGNADTIESFKTTLLSEYKDSAKVVVEESLR